MIWDDGGLTIFVGEYVFRVEWVLLLALLLTLFATYLVGSALLNWFGVGGRGSCRWRRLRNEGGMSLTKWKCRRCGVEAFTSNQQPPKECKRKLEGRPL
jgi:hypothetical protein